MWNRSNELRRARQGHCPDAVYLFGPFRQQCVDVSGAAQGTSGGGGASGGGTGVAVAKGSKVMRVTSRPKTVRRPAPPYPKEWYNMPKLRDTPQLEAELHGHAMANVLGLYNARRDGGAYGLPTWQISVANGAATVGAPNGSTVGIASEAELRDALTCPYSCWAHANFQPAGTLRALIQRAARKLSRSEPLTCAHMRTMWVDDHGACQTQEVATRSSFAAWSIGIRVGRCNMEPAVTRTLHRLEHEERLLLANHFSTTRAIDRRCGN